MEQLEFNSPATVKEGQDYTVSLTVTNCSTKAGVPVEAMLGIGISAATDFVTLISAQVNSEHFAPNETRKFSYPMNVPPGTAGQPGLISAWVETPEGGVIVSALEDVIIIRTEPSSLLISYQGYLAACIEDCRLGVPTIMLPIYGLQNPCTGRSLMEDLMIWEAISIGMIASSADAYFQGAVMYYLDGTTIVPYWWTCPYCPEKFRSPEQLAQHKEAVHGDIILTKATITGCGVQYACVDPPWCDEHEPWRTVVTWRNDSPFAITGRASIPGSGADALVSPGGSVTVYLPLPSVRGYYLPVTLTLVGEPLDGMVLDRSSFDFHG